MRTRSRFKLTLLFGAAILLGLAGKSRADAPEKDWNMVIGGGYTPVVGGMNSQLTGGWNFEVGAQYNVTDQAGVRLEYMGNNGGIESGILDRYKAMIGGLTTEGSTHIWSLSVSPVWHFEMNDVVGGYFIGGGGFYHLNAQVTTPGAAFVPGYCDPWWGCWPGGFVAADRLIAEHKDDTGGINAGVGFDFNLWRGDVVFFVESRYHYILAHGPNVQLLPLTAGFRF